MALFKWRQVLIVLNAKALSLGLGSIGTFNRALGLGKILRRE